MRHKKAVSIATVAVAATWFTMATSSAATVRIYIPWTEQTVFALGPNDGYVAEWNGLSQGWAEIGGPASGLYAGSAGVFATDPTTGDIAEYNGTPGSWTVIGGPGAQFAEGGGHLYGLGPNDSYVAEWNGPGQGWTVIGGPAAAIYAGAYGLFATAPKGTNGDILQYNGTPNNWTDIGGAGAGIWGEVGVGSNAVYRAIEQPDAAGKYDVEEWTSATGWTTIMAAPFVDGLIAGSDGVFVRVINGSVTQWFAFDGSPNNWTVISTLGYHGDGLNPEAVSRTALYAENYDEIGNHLGVAVYSGTGTSWTTIGGPASEIVAGD